MNKIISEVRQSKSENPKSKIAACDFLGKGKLNECSGYIDRRCFHH